MDKNNEIKEIRESEITLEMGRLFKKQRERESANKLCISHIQRERERGNMKTHTCRIQNDGVVHVPPRAAQVFFRVV